MTKKEKKLNGNFNKFKGKVEISIEIKKKSFRSGHFLKETMNSIWRRISYVPLPLRRWPGNHFS